MALQQDNKDLQAQDSQFKEFLLNLSKGQEYLKTLFVGNLTKEHPDNNKDKQLEQLQAEVEAMRTQMLRQMALIQGLARGQEELRSIINKLHQDGYNRMKQAVEAGDQVINQPQMRQKIDCRLFPKTSQDNYLNDQQKQVLD